MKGGCAKEAAWFDGKYELNGVHDGKATWKQTITQAHQIYWDAKRAECAAGRVDTIKVTVSIVVSLPYDSKPTATRMSLEQNIIIKKTLCTFT